MQKVDGVDTVVVTLKEGHARLTLKPGNKVTLNELRKLIERNGFTPRGATVTAEAEEVTSANGATQIRVTAANETFPIASATSDAARAELKQQAGKSFIVEGVIPAAKDNPTGAVEIKAVKPIAK